MRIDATNPKCPEWHKYLFPCECAETSFLGVDWWDDSTGTYVEISPAFWATTFWGRIKLAVKLLAGKEVYSGHSVLLEKDSISELIETLAMARDERKTNDKH